MKHPATSATATRYPERWIRIPVKGHCPDTGMSRPMFYDLMKRGVIRFAHIVAPGNTRGMRFVYLPSVLKFLDDQADKTMRKATSTPVSP